MDLLFSIYEPFLTLPKQWQFLVSLAGKVIMSWSQHINCNTLISCKEEGSGSLLLYSIWYVVLQKMCSTLINDKNCVLCASAFTLTKLKIWPLQTTDVHFDWALKHCSSEKWTVSWLACTWADVFCCWIPCLKCTILFNKTQLKRSLWWI